MASGVSTTSKYLKSGITVCDACLSCLFKAASSLKSNYNSAGLRWKDEKYVSLGKIVESCCKELMKPVSELNDCRESLEKLLSAVEEYESQNL